MENKPSELELKILNKLYEYYVNTQQLLEWKCVDAFKELGLKDGSHVGTVNSSKYVKMVPNGTHEHWKLTDEGIRYMENSDNEINRNKLLVNQLKEDITAGESLSVEFKEFKLETIDKNEIDDLSRGVAALASRGGRIYIGISDDKKIIGINGSVDDWMRVLISRSTGEKLQPKVVFELKMIKLQGEDEEITQVLEIEIAKGEPMYYFHHVPYVRDYIDSVPQSRKANPDDVKNAFRSYFNTTPAVDSNDNSAEATESSQLLSSIISSMMNILINLSLRGDKVGEPLKDMRLRLEYSKAELEALIPIVKRNETLKEFYNQIDKLIKDINTALNHQLFLGSDSWEEYMQKLTAVYEVALQIFNKIKAEKPKIPNVDELRDEVFERVIRWLEMFDNYKIRDFKYEAFEYTSMLMRYYYAATLANSNDQSLEKIKSYAEEIEKLSWGMTNVDAQQLVKRAKELPTELKSLRDDVNG